jgi:uncharacterized protein with HEPN domain
MNLEQKKYLFDILESITAIEFHIKGISGVREFTENLTVVDAVKRRLGIIGEALGKADKKNSMDSITSKSNIIGLRHILIHDYDKINDETIWIICTKNMTLLKSEIEQLLRD